MMGLNALEQKVIEWGMAKEILPDPDPFAQFLKTCEEVEELGSAISDHDTKEIKDAIGDIMVTLVMQSQAWGYTLEECFEAAYDEIKNRQGRMENGQFVKEEK
jgi:NTP pyrophosphatase (non-canonical NTP hydrolase)